VWRRGSVVASWLLDLTALALSKIQTSRLFWARIGSGEGRGQSLPRLRRVPAPVLSAALYQRFSSRGADDFARKILSAMRFEFGGHVRAPQRR